MTAARKTLAAMLAVLAAATMTAACSSDAEQITAQNVDGVETATFEYTIPAGAGAANLRGEPLNILPAVLDAHVGDTIRLINEDDQGHLVGPFYVGAGETLTQAFSSPGTFIGECSVHEDGQVTLNVTELDGTD